MTSTYAPNRACESRRRARFGCARLIELFRALYDETARLFSVLYGTPLRWKDLALGGILWETLTWDSVAWDSVAWDSVAWDSVAWDANTLD